MPDIIPNADPNVANPAAPQGTGAPNPMANPEITRVVEQARQEEKQKLYSTITKTKETNRTLEQQLAAQKAEKAALEAKVRSFEESGMSGDDLLKKKIGEMEQQIRDGQQLLITQQQNLAAQIRNSELKAYRERRMREFTAQGAQFFEDQVVGNSEEEIEQSLAMSQSNYNSMRQRFHNEFLMEQQRQAEFQRQQQPVAQPQFVAQPMPVQPMNPIYARPAPTVGVVPQNAQMMTHVPARQNPNFAQPNPAVPTPVVQGGYYMGQLPGPNGYQPAGFPTAPAASAPGDQVVQQNQMSQLTSEDSIRSGEYAKHRSELLASVRTRTVGR